MLGSSWTMDLKGQQRVEIAAMNDKHQMTLVVCGFLSGNVLPFQLIYQGKTAASVPKVNFPKEWHVTATENHGSNEEKTKEYSKLIIRITLYRNEAKGVRSSYHISCLGSF